ncbi:HNH endonuclease [Nocardioides sp. W3-2-3]|uniref:HNH endonuclease n=1 Tax=Nocardioides convexus TaxID=2712224 RepID=UPI0024185636|nr:HNH endonuclease signature motif containing protein [Nocardioides convexus]NHA00518.1 HNH endonuclease [Nocardioides convexus]
MLRAYGGRCAITGDDISGALDACHIHAHAAGGSMETTNGVLLRSDLHTLFDLGLIAINTETWTVLVHASIRDTVSGRALAGARFRRPTAAADCPSKDALDQHRSRCGL